ncbi:MAG: AtpZ/AtpI family protein [Nitrospirota bacterium]|jgi:ATP synthase protein I
MDEFKEEIGKKEKRKLRALRKGEHSVWFGLGMFGLVGWAIAIPTLVGIAIGLWLDARRPAEISWTLTFLFAGVILGCLNAWYWVSKERKEIERRGREE